MKKIVALFLILLLPIALSFTFGCSQKKEEPVATEEEAPGAVQAPAEEQVTPAAEEGAAKPAEEAAKPAETPAAPAEGK